MLAIYPLRDLGSPSFCAIWQVCPNSFFIYKTTKNAGNVQVNSMEGYSEEANDPYKINQKISISRSRGSHATLCP